MKGAELLRELVYPIAHPAVVIPVIASWLLFSLALAFGLYGLLLFAVTLVPFNRHLICVLSARARGLGAPAFDAELMTLVGDAWQLTPLVFVSVSLWIFYLASQEFSKAVAAVVVVLFALALPCVLAVLTITRSPLQAINPLPLFRFINATGVGYFVLIVVLGVVAAALFLVHDSGAPSIIVRLGIIYFLYLVSSMTGALVCRFQLTKKVDIAEPLAMAPQESRDRLLGKRQQVANHAYGFISRGNRQGGFRHIQSAIDDDPDTDDAYAWFFAEMLTWDNPDAAMFFAQGYLHRLLELSDHHNALKLVSQCLHLEPRFRPAMDDREAVIEIAGQNGRQDLIGLSR